MTAAPNIPQDFAAWDALDTFTDVAAPGANDVRLAPLPLAAQISLENAARLRYQQRTGKRVQLVTGGESNPQVLAVLCEHCGERPGKAHQVRYTPRAVHICNECIAQERRYAVALSERYGFTPHVRPVLALPSGTRRDQRRKSC